MKFFCMVLMSLALTACGGGSDDDAYEPEAKPETDAVSACLVKPTRPGQPHQPMPPGCSTK